MHLRARDAARRGPSLPGGLAAALGISLATLICLAGLSLLNTEQQPARRADAVDPVEQQPARGSNPVDPVAVVSSSLAPAGHPAWLEELMARLENREHGYLWL